MIVTSSLFPEPPKRQYPEARLQADVHQFLSVALPANAIHFAVPNGLMRSKKAAARARGEGVRAGVCDLCIVWDGRPVFVELKTKNGRLSDAQREVHRRLTYCRADVLLCRSVDEVAQALRGIGMPLRASVSA